MIGHHHPNCVPISPIKTSGIIIRHQFGYNPRFTPTLQDLISNLLEIVLVGVVPEQLNHLLSQRHDITSPFRPR